VTIFGDDFYQKSPVSPKSKGLANQHIFHQISVGVAPLFSQIIQDGTLPPMDPKQESEGNQWGWVYGTKGRLTRFSLESGVLCQLLGYMGGVYGNFQIPTISDNEFYIPQHFNDGNVARET
jgi:hypothetical protein